MRNAPARSPGLGETTATLSGGKKGRAVASRSTIRRLRVKSITTRRARSESNLTAEELSSGPTARVLIDALKTK
jgi:hypothetical protein